MRCRQHCSRSLQKLQWCTVLQASASAVNLSHRAAERSARSWGPAAKKCSNSRQKVEWQEYYRRLALPEQMCNFSPLHVCDQSLVSSGAGGKHHSAVVTDNGESYTFGSNLHGQCGTGSIKSKDKIEGKCPLLTTPMPVATCYRKLHEVMSILSIAASYQHMLTGTTMLSCAYSCSCCEALHVPHLDMFRPTRVTVHLCS